MNSFTLLLFALTAIWARLLASLAEAPPKTVPLGNVTDWVAPVGACMDSCSAWPAQPAKRAAAPIAAIVPRMIFI